MVILIFSDKSSLFIQSEVGGCHWLMRGGRNWFLCPSAPASTDSMYFLKKPAELSEMNYRDYLDLKIA
jgi:hypothetical protein